MTTFTLQDLTPEQQDTEALQSMAKLGGGVDINVLLDGHVGIGKAEAVAKHEAMHAWTKVVHERSLDAPEPQPTLCESTQTDIPTIINTICTQLQLLSTVIKGERAQGATPPEGANLHDCVEQVLVQASWFEELVKRQLEAMGVEDIAESVVENLVERDVENYFDTRFDPTDHFDMDDAIASRVDDSLDDIVRERLDEVVHEQLEEVVAEKLSEASVSISF